jgi:hypothetical protein
MVGAALMGAIPVEIALAFKCLKDGLLIVWLFRRGR